ncbi:MFS transporter [Mumia sp. zg.B53]|uniref:MFS transporter n=1 Tax=unclassified Mumia TaxID=2621872 RepID=UPI001C6E6085|nr:MULTISPECIES: MFS transporter [unclassified Mumia]MBW9205299.1 MFS transporter [Mumia sp. zg.B17]MBW9208702.1 MFS transporter [Mumia sp. zg.B21]MBW9213313.1 MFS transporter [Mumia sp. zg.B53]
MDSAPSSTPLSSATGRGYALGSVATGTFATVPGLLLLPYLTDTLGVAAGIAGLMVLLPKAWDVVLNPIAGRISDRSTSSRGRRRPFLLRAGVLLAVTFALIFAGPAEPTWLAGTWVVVLFLACASAYAFFQVPYVAMPAEMTLDYDERTRLMTWRVVVLALAILLSGATAPLVVDVVGDASSETTGYRVMGAYIGVILLLGALGAYRGTRDAPDHGVATAGGSMRDQLRLVAQSPDFRHLLTTFVLQALGIGAMLAGVAYVADHLLDSGSATTLLFVAFVGPALLVTPLWERVAARRGKRYGYTAATGILVLGALGLLVASTGQALAAYAAAAVVGIGYAGAQVFPMAMIPDVAADHAARTGANRIGVFTGVWTAGETLGLALGPGLFAAVLSLGGYVSSREGEDVTQPDSALDAIVVGVSVVPALLIIVSLLSLRRYRLDERLHRNGAHDADADPTATPQEPTP